MSGFNKRVRRGIAGLTAIAAIGTASGCALPGSSASTADQQLQTGYSYVAVPVAAQVPIYRQPSGRVLTRLANPNGFGAPLVLLATQRQADWIKVLLPIRPNGIAGWVPASQIRLTVDPWRVTVNRSKHRLDVLYAGRSVSHSTVGVGAKSTPTPPGTFYITSLLQQPDPSGAYGPFAFGLSGYSPVIKHFAGGPGELGLHGTDATWSIGESVTHGCIRVPNDFISTLAGKLPLGTPVVVT